MASKDAAIVTRDLHHDGEEGLGLTNKKERKKKKKKKSKKKRKSKDVIEATAEAIPVPSGKRQKVEPKSEAPAEVAPKQPPSDQDVAKKKKRKKKKDRRTKKPASDTNHQSEASKGAVSPEDGKQEEASGGDQGQLAVSFPFPTDPDDHCESPIQAYAHIQPFLQQLQSTTKQSSLRIYDPYYCNGGVVKNLKALGFGSVHNKKEDCYKVWASPSNYPSYDVLCTNPPYSDNHVQDLIEHVTGPMMKSRPWFLLMPEWAHKKDYYQSLMKQKGIQPFYLVPKKRYVYVPPSGFRASKKSDTHKKSSPFNSMWYIWGGTREQNDHLIQHYYSRNCTFPFLGGNDDTIVDSIESVSRAPLMDAVDLARSKSALRDLRRKHKK